MKKPIFVRPAGDKGHESEGKMYYDWAKENSSNNEFDPMVGTFPSSVTWCAYDKDGPLAFQTIQRPLMLESLAPRPGASHQQITVALRELVQNAISQAHIVGSGEIYFLGSNEDTNALATGQIFEEVPMKIFRVKLRDLEG